MQENLRRHLQIYAVKTLHLLLDSVSERYLFLILIDLLNLF